jgi:hypothetical protein
MKDRLEPENESFGKEAEPQNDEEMLNANRKWLQSLTKKA